MFFISLSVVEKAGFKATTGQTHASFFKAWVNSI
jgi:hypothetical protein